MHVSVVAFTGRGIDLACRIAEGFASQGWAVQVHAPAHLAEGRGVAAYESLATWTGQAFARSDALIFVSACGIAVRSIAPFVRDKMDDPAVVCVDECGHYCVSLLSGHVGGANRLARTVALLVGAEPVVTTATEVRGIFAVDEWAAGQGLALCDREEAKAVSAHLLAGGTVGMRSDWPIAGDLPEGLVWDEAGLCELGVSVSLDPGARPFEHTLRLVPRVVTVGMGCRRGTTADALMDVLGRCLAQAHVAWEAVAAVATINLKADEEGLLALADRLGVPLRSYTAEQLAGVEGTFSSSAFVLQTVGVDNVCERAACAAGGTLIAHKFAMDGVTVALAVNEVRLTFGEASPAGKGGGAQ